MTDQNTLVGSGPITPRCLSTLPLDIAEILELFEKQKISK